MRILIRSKFKAGGPGAFIRRLPEAISKLPGVSVVSDPSRKFDAELAFIRSEGGHGKPLFIRLDGCYYQRKQASQNRGISDGVRLARGVIYQSAFSRQMCESILGVSNANSVVIHNGIDFGYVASVQPHTGVPPESWIACADWRESKRPYSTVMGFLKSGSPGNLYMVGSGLEKAKYAKHPRVVLTGSLKEPQVLAYMKACRHQLHLCFIDSCPNAVVEGLSCGLSVLCTNLGGTPELVGESGIVLQVDDFKHKVGDYPSLDSLDHRLVADGIDRLRKRPPIVSRMDLDLNKVAEQYIDFIRKCM